MLRIPLPRRVPAAGLLLALFVLCVAGASRADARPAASATQHSASAPVAAKARPKACKRGQTRLRLKGRARCIGTRALFRGLPKGTDALASRLVGSSRRLDAKAGGARSLATLLGADAAAIGVWEDAVAKAGLAETNRRLSAAGAAAHARAAQDESLGLPKLPGSLSELVQRASTAIGIDPKPDLQNDQGRATVKASLSGKGKNYQFEVDETKPQGVYCPDKKGQVNAYGGLKARRDGIQNGQEVVEGFDATYTVNGHVDAAGNLKTYDIIVQWENATGTLKGVKPTSSAFAILDAKSIDISWPEGRSKDLEFGMAEAMRYAQEQALRHLDKAENVWNKAASCIRVETTPKVVKAGKSATATIKAFSRLTGKPIEADVSLEPAGGATVTPAKTTTSPAKPGKAKVTMPRKAKGSRARAAAAAKVAVTVRSKQGIGRASIGSTDIPDAYDVALDLNGLGRFATHDATGTMNATWQAKRDDAAGAVRWTGGARTAWANLAATTKTPGCPLDTPVDGAGTLSVTVVANDKGDAVTVTLGYGAGTVGAASVLQSSFTVRCDGDPPPPPVPGMPGPSLVDLGPLTFTLPITGGTQALATGPEVQDGGDGFFTTGTLKLTPAGG